MQVATLKFGSYHKHIFILIIKNKPTCERTTLYNCVTLLQKFQILVEKVHLICQPLGEEGFRKY